MADRREIREELARQNIRVNEQADMVGEKDYTISRIMSGAIKNVPVNLALEISGALNTPVKKLFPRG